MKAVFWFSSVVLTTCACGTDRSNFTAAACCEFSSPPLDHIVEQREKTNEGIRIGKEMRPDISHNLTSQVVNSETIIVGTIGKKIREAYTPYNATGPDQHVVYEVHIDEVIKTAEKDLGVTIKVRQEGGDLPWTTEAAFGKGLRFEGSPLLQPKRKYVLFLNRPGRQPGMRALPYIARMHKGEVSRAGELDEFTICGGYQGQLDVTSGKAVPPQEPSGFGIKPWRFRFDEPKSILGLSTEDLVKLIKQELDRYSKGVAEALRSADMIRQRSMIPPADPPEEP